MWRYLNSFNIVGLILFGLAIWGFVQGADVLRDPAQPRDMRLPLMYLFGAVVMVLNGFISIRVYRQKTARAASDAKETSS